MDIAAWLHGLGVQKYEAAFRENAIDAAVLPELTADELRDLGVNLVAHRRKLLAAIAELEEGLVAVASPVLPDGRTVLQVEAVHGVGVRGGEEHVAEADDRGGIPPLRRAGKRRGVGA